MLGCEMVLLIGAGLFFDGIDLFLPGSLLPFLVRDHLAKALDVALLPSLTAVGLLLGALLAAYLGDHRGRKALYQFNLVVYAVGTLLCACAPTFLWLLIFRFISALGLGGESVVGSGMFPEFLPPQKRGVWCTFLSLITTLSFPVAAGLAAVVLPTLG
jgi:putative MFS transporter